MTDLSALPTPTIEEAPPKTYNVRGIPVELINRYWPFAIPYIKRALDRTTGELTIDDYKRFAEAAQIQLWLVHDGRRICGAATTEIVPFESRSRLRVLTVGGARFDLWAGALDLKLREWALTYKCDGVEWYIRKGFVPSLRTLGYTHKVSIVFKPVPLPTRPPAADYAAIKRAERVWTAQQES